MSSEERPRLVCRCLGVASPRIHAAVRTGGLQSVADVTKAVRAGGGCGLCHPEIEEILAEVRAEPVDPGLVLENQLVCRQETTSRVEGSLGSLIAPRLAAMGTRIESVSVDGLRVRVRLGGNAIDAAARFVAEKLRKYVCEDLAIEIER
jgi:NifU-like protein